MRFFSIGSYNLREWQYFISASLDRIWAFNIVLHECRIQLFIAFSFLSIFCSGAYKAFTVLDLRWSTTGCTSIIHIF